MNSQIPPSAGLKTPLHNNDWKTQRLKFLFRRLSRPACNDHEVVTAFRDGVVTRRSNRREDGFTFADKEIGYQGIQRGDLAIHAMDGFAGAIGVSDSEGKVSPVLSVLEPRDVGTADPHFWAYYLRNLAVSGYISSLAKGIRERSTDFRWKDAGDLLVNHPDLPTQKRIAEFLDRETGRIDELIAKKERLVVLLRERGVAAREELLWGDGPISKLGHHTSILPGYAFASANFSDNPEDIRLLRGANVGVDEIRWDDTVYWPAADVKGVERFRLEAGNLVMGMDRPWISGGIRVSEITEADLPCLLLQRVCKISPRKTLEARYLKAMIESKRFVAYFEPILTGVSVPHISGDQIANFRFPFISIDQQVQRMDDLAKITQSIQPITRVTLASIDRLREYRAALITAAVTGQIDVDTYGKTGTTSATLDKIEEEMHG